MSKRITITLDNEEYKLFKKPTDLGEKDSVRGRNMINAYLINWKENK